MIDGVPSGTTTITRRGAFQMKGGGQDAPAKLARSESAISVWLLAVSRTATVQSALCRISRCTGHTRVSRGDPNKTHRRHEASPGVRSSSDFWSSFHEQPTTPRRIKPCQLCRCRPASLWQSALSQRDVPKSQPRQCHYPDVSGEGIQRWFQGFST